MVHNNHRILGCQDPLGYSSGNLAYAVDFLGRGSVLHIQFILNFIIITSNLKGKTRALQWLNEVDLMGGTRAIS